MQQPFKLAAPRRLGPPKKLGDASPFLRLPSTSPSAAGTSRVSKSPLTLPARSVVPLVNNSSVLPSENIQRPTQQHHSISSKDSSDLPPPSKLVASKQPAAVRTPPRKDPFVAGGVNRYAAGSSVNPLTASSPLRKREAAKEVNLTPPATRHRLTGKVERSDTQAADGGSDLTSSRRRLRQKLLIHFHKFPPGTVLHAALRAQQGRPSTLPAAEAQTFSDFCVLPKTERSYSLWHSVGPTSLAIFTNDSPSHLGLRSFVRQSQRRGSRGERKRSPKADSKSKQQKNGSEFSMATVGRPQSVHSSEGSQLASPVRRDWRSSDDKALSKEVHTERQSTKLRIQAALNAVRHSRKARMQMIAGSKDEEEIAFAASVNPNLTQSTSAQGDDHRDSASPPIVPQPTQAFKDLASRARYDQIYGPTQTRDVDSNSCSSRSFPLSSSAAWQLTLDMWKRMILTQSAQGLIVLGNRSFVPTTLSQPVLYILHAAALLGMSPSRMGDGDSNVSQICERISAACDLLASFASYGAASAHGSSALRALTRWDLRFDKGGVLKELRVEAFLLDNGQETLFRGRFFHSVEMALHILFLPSKLSRIFCSRSRSPDVDEDQKQLKVALIPAWRLVADQHTLPDVIKWVRKLKMLGLVTDRIRTLVMHLLAVALLSLPAEGSGTSTTASDDFFGAGQLGAVATQPSVGTGSPIISSSEELPKNSFPPDCSCEMPPHAQHPLPSDFTSILAPKNSRDVTAPVMERPDTGESVAEGITPHNLVVSRTYLLGFLLGIDLAVCRSAIETAARVHPLRSSIQDAYGEGGVSGVASAGRSLVCEVSCTGAAVLQERLFAFLIRVIQVSMSQLYSTQLDAADCTGGSPLQQMYILESPFVDLLTERESATLGCIAAQSACECLAFRRLTQLEVLLKRQGIALAASHGLNSFDRDLGLNGQNVTTFDFADAMLSESGFFLQAEAYQQQQFESADKAFPGRIPSGNSTGSALTFRHPVGVIEISKKTLTAGCMRLADTYAAFCGLFAKGELTRKLGWNSPPANSNMTYFQGLQSAILQALSPFLELMPFVAYREHGGEAVSRFLRVIKAWESTNLSVWLSLNEFCRIFGILIEANHGAAHEVADIREFLACTVDEVRPLLPMYGNNLPLNYKCGENGLFLSNSLFRVLQTFQSAVRKDFVKKAMRHNAKTAAEHDAEAKLSSTYPSKKQNYIEVTEAGSRLRRHSVPPLQFDRYGKGRVESGQPFNVTTRSSTLSRHNQANRPLRSSWQQPDGSKGWRGEITF